jgi:hypothetical protein
MNYELAQELKDAGFPNIKDLQHRQGREFILPNGSVPVYSLGDAQNIKDWFIPILEELIEACGEKFDRLVAHHDRGAWDATSEKDSDGFFKSASGKTPTEAVARLWLALHPMANEAHPGQDRPDRPTH